MQEVFFLEPTFRVDSNAAYCTKSCTGASLCACQFVLCRKRMILRDPLKNISLDTTVYVQGHSGGPFRTVILDNVLRKSHSAALSYLCMLWSLQCYLGTNRLQVDSYLPAEISATSNLVVVYLTK